MNSGVCFMHREAALGPDVGQKLALKKNCQGKQQHMWGVMSSTQHVVVCDIGPKGGQQFCGFVCGVLCQHSLVGL